MHCKAQEKATSTLSACHERRRKQYFCTGDNDSNGTSSEMLISSSTETGTLKVGEVEDVQKKAKAVKKASSSESSNVKTFATKKLTDSSGGRGGIVIYFQGRKGKKFLQINKVKILDSRKRKNSRFPRIRVPEDAYALVEAVDELLGKLATKEGLDVSYTSDSHQLLYSALSHGKRYIFKLDLCCLDNKGGYSINLTINSKKCKSAFPLSIEQLLWLRHQMGEMLAEHDGSQPVDEPPECPQWLLADESKAVNANASIEMPNSKPTETGIKLAKTKKLIDAGLVIDFKQDQSGKKYFAIVQIRKIRGRQMNCFNFSQILVPEDAYPLVSAMDELLEELPTKEGLDAFTSTSDSVCPFLFSTSSPGTNYDYKLDLKLVNGRHFTVDLITCKNEGAKSEHEERTLHLNIREFFWLRERIGKYLARYVRIRSEHLKLPPKRPCWLLTHGSKAVYANASSTDEMPNSSSTGEIGTATIKEAIVGEKAKKKSRRKEEASRIVGGRKRLAVRKLLDSSGVRGIVIRLTVGQGRIGTKFFQIAQILDIVEGDYCHFKNILVPEDAYPLARAMDELLEELVTKEGMDVSPMSGCHQLLYSAKSRGKIDEYRLELCLKNGRFSVDLSRSKRNEAQLGLTAEKTIQISIKEFLWLRHRMGELLAEHDGSEELKPPPKCPHWLLPEGEEAIEEAGSDVERLARVELFDRSREEKLSIELNQGRSGNKFMAIEKRVMGVPIFRSKFVPLDVYPFIRAMDELLGELATKVGQNLSMPSKGSHLLFSTSSPGQNNNFKLNLGLDNGIIFVDLSTCRNEANPGHVEKTLQLSIEEFFWLRYRMYEILAEHDGNEKLKPVPENGNYD